MNTLKFQHKQRGATLLTSLGLLMVMTVIGVTATKMSSIEALVAGNEQTKMKLFQTTQSDLYKFTTPVQLMPVLLDDTLFDNNDEYAAGHDSLKTETITKLSPYTCKGINGLAVSIGGPCKLFDFGVSTRSVTGGAREESHRGAGKEVPPTSPNCLICR